MKVSGRIMTGWAVMAGCAAIVTSLALVIKVNPHGFGTLLAGSRPVPAVSEPAPVVVPAVAAEKALPPGGWKEDFSAVSGLSSALPKGWVLQGKPGTRPADFSVRPDPETGGAFLHMEADSASSSLIVKLDGVDLKKTPVLMWRWRVNRLPDGADGRSRSADDQAIGIYVGTGSAMNNKSVSYRWDTLTPKGSEGNCVYGLGTVKVKWYTIKNAEDAREGRWFVEERNVAEDFEDAWGLHPREIYLSVSCNSQYTGSTASADLAWIGFAPEGAGSENAD